MTNSASGLVKYRRLRVPHLAVAFAIIVGMGAPIFNAASAGTASEIAPRIRGLYEAYLGRPLTDAEFQRVYAEEGTEPEKFDANVLEALDKGIGMLRNEQGKPSALHFRHVIAEGSAFEENKPFGKKLVMAVDPVVVLDARRKQVMTKKDILAFVQILKFSRSGADPREIEKARGPNDTKLAASVTSELRTMIAKGGALPEMVRDSSAFWAGLVQNWASLSSQDKAAARNYVAKNMAGKLTEMPESLYSRLMGWSSFEIKMAHLNKTIEVGQMWQMTYSHMLNLQMLYDAWQTR